MNKLIERILSNFKVPVEFLRYDGNQDTYITYMETSKDDSFSADNEMLAYVSYYDFDIYSKKNYLSVIEDLKKILINNGFIYEPSRDSSDMFEDDTGYYHKTLCFAIPVYLIEREE